MRSGILLAVVLGGTSGVVADILHVPGDFPTIQEAIVAAVDGDEVEVHPGTYNENINFLGKAIRVYSTDGPDVTIIDAQGAGSVVTCESDEGLDTVLEGFTITNGYDGRGGGMYNLSSSPTVIDCVFSHNSVGPCGHGCVPRGGGMYNKLSNPTITNCTFIENSADAPDNKDAYGGGMYNSFSNPTVTNCTFNGNTAFNGGGMYEDGGSTSTVTNCMFIGNITVSSGGGMYEDGNSSTVTNCTFSGNIAGGYGGGMHSSIASPSVINCTFNGNTAFDGGGLSAHGNSVVTVTNCILWGNSPNQIEDFGWVTVSHSCVDGGYKGPGNIDADPMFVDAPGGDLHLSPGSPAIDAADNSAVPKGVVTDLDGYDRFVDTPCTDDTGKGKPPIVDMGAYEFQLFQVTCRWDLDCNGRVGVGDMLFFLAAWGPCPPKEFCPADFNGNGNVGVNDLLALLANWGPCP